MSSTFQIKKRMPVLALAAVIASVTVGFAALPAAASGGTGSADDYRPSAWAEHGRSGTTAETPSLTSDVGQPEGGTGLQLLVGAGLVAIGLLGLALASSAARRRRAAMRRSRPAGRWRPVAQRAAKTPARP